jgi:hypothetical protein
MKSASKFPAGPQAWSWPVLRQTVVAAVTLLSLLLAANPAVAQSFSANDGYAADGSYKLQVELTPYLWLPRTQTNFSLGPRGGISGTTSTGIPTAQQLANSLHGAFMGYGLMRYGPWSTELDIDWITASQGKNPFIPALGRTANLSVSATVLRIAPGFGYKIYTGELGAMPFTVDARAGFAVFDWSAKIGSEGNLLGGVSDSSSFVQPWLGTRLSLYPAAKWRIELAALGQGFGVGGGSWGWGASALVSYAITDWIAITGGYRALRSSRSEESPRSILPATRSLDLLAYGPILGIAFRF